MKIESIVHTSESSENDAPITFGSNQPKFRHTAAVYLHRHTGKITERTRYLAASHHQPVLCFRLITQFGKNYAILHPENFRPGKHLFGISTVGYGSHLRVVERIAYLHAFERLIAAIRTALITYYVSHVSLAFLQALIAGKRNRGIASHSIFRTPGDARLVVRIAPIVNRLFIHHLCRTLILHNQYTELVERLRRRNTRNRTA